MVLEQGLEGDEKVLGIVVLWRGRENPTTRAKEIIYLSFRTPNK